MVSDPFAGGGVIPLAAVARGHQVYAQNLNPWATTGLSAMLALPDADALRAGIAALTQRVLPEAAAAYGTVLSNGSPGQVSHTVRVAVAACTGCGTRQRLFPHALVSLLARVERNQPGAFLACPNGHLFEGRRDRPKACPTCGTRTEPDTAYTPRRQATCSCGHSKRLEARAGDGLDWEVVLVERAGANRRELALPARSELPAAQGAGSPPASWVPSGRARRPRCCSGTASATGRTSTPAASATSWSAYSSSPTTAPATRA